MSDIVLCSKNGCRRKKGHKGECKINPYEVWSFLEEKDQKKLSKAGYATPRGGKKGAYQNHVYRNNKVIIPYEKLDVCNLNNYKDGYIVRLYPDQAFEEAGKLKKLKHGTLDVVIGENAFLLYRSHDSFESLPPLEEWEIRHLEDSDGNRIKRRSKTCVDKGHYILRLPSLGGGNTIKKNERIEGDPQGIFAPEYATAEINYLAQVVLAWQIVHTADSPYTSQQASHIKAILSEMELDHGEHFKFYGMMRGDFTICPLCLRRIKYEELHKNIDLENEAGLGNSGVQVEGTTRSTIVNLFHMYPLSYDGVHHIPQHVSWGHATCNTKLGQRRCFSLDELRSQNVKVATVDGEDISTFGWISQDKTMIRSAYGGVWIQITTDDPNELKDED